MLARLPGAHPVCRPAALASLTMGMSLRLAPHGPGCVQPTRLASAAAVGLAVHSAGGLRGITSQKHGPASPSRAMHRESSSRTSDSLTHTYQKPSNGRKGHSQRALVESTLLTVRCLVRKLCSVQSCTQIRYKAHMRLLQTFLHGYVIVPAHGDTCQNRSPPRVCGDVHQVTAVDSQSAAAPCAQGQHLPVICA